MMLSPPPCVLRLVLTRQSSSSDQQLLFPSWSSPVAGEGGGDREGGRRVGALLFTVVKKTRRSEQGSGTLENRLRTAEAIQSGYQFRGARVSPNLRAYTAARDAHELAPHCAPAIMFLHLLANGHPAERTHACTHSLQQISCSRLMFLQ